MPGIFITGTDTGVGKTVVTTAILSILRRSGINALPMKPAHSGCSTRKGKLIPDDVEFTLKALHMTIPDQLAGSVVPYRFKHACSPHLAASLEKTVISIPHILASARRLQQISDAIVVEGAGGLMVPLTPHCLVVDLIAKMKLPTLLVARPILGTLNHTLLSLQCMRTAGINVLGVILNSTTPSTRRTTYIQEDNINTLRRLGNVPVFGPLPFDSKLSGQPQHWNEYEKRLTGLLPSANQLLQWMKQA